MTHTRVKRIPPGFFGRLGSGAPALHSGSPLAPAIWAARDLISGYLPDRDQLKVTVVYAGDAR